MIKGLGEPHDSLDLGALTQIKKITTIENPAVINIHNIQNAHAVNEFMQLAPTMRYVHDHRLYCPGFSKTWYNSNQMCPIPFSYECLVNAYKEHCATRRPGKLLQKFHDKFYELDINRKLPKILLASHYMASQMEINKFDKKYLSQKSLIESVLASQTQLATIFSYDKDKGKKDSLVFLKEIEAKNKYQKGKIYVYKLVKSKADDERWSVAFVPDSKNGISSDIQVINAGYYIDKNKTEAENYNEILDYFNLTYRKRAITPSGGY